jgi:hypothetical protein
MLTKVNASPYKAEEGRLVPAQSDAPAGRRSDASDHHS